MRRLTTFVAVALIALALGTGLACNSKPGATGATAGGSPTPPAATPTPDPAAAAADAAVQAALAFFGAVQVPDATACRAQTQPCIDHGLDPDSPDRGVTVMELGDPSGGAAEVVFGLQANGQWAFWFGTQQQVYHALALPAQMRVCADGTGVNLRQAADANAPVVTALKDGTLVTAESFVLTQAGAYNRPGPTGNGWYALSSPAKGFVRADFLSVATLGDCSLRDQLTKSS